MSQKQKKMQPPDLNRFDLSFSFDDELFEIPNNSDSIETCVEEIDHYLALNGELDEDSQDFPTVVQALGQMGSLLRLLGELEDAQECLEIAIGIVQKKDLNPLYATPQWIRLADVFRENGQHETAAQILKNVVEDCHNVPALEEFESAAFQTLGKVFFTKKLYHEAQGFFEKALAMKKQNPSKAKSSGLGSLEATQFAIDRARIMSEKSVV